MIYCLDYTLHIFSPVRESDSFLLNQDSQVYKNLVILSLNQSQNIGTIIILSAWPLQPCYGNHIHPEFDLFLPSQPRYDFFVSQNLLGNFFVC
jgi:hypothetical protein